MTHGFIEIAIVIGIDSSACFGSQLLAESVSASNP
jgi:hypothetical protein